MSTHIPKRSHGKIRQFFDDGFSISELAIMYHTSTNFIEEILDSVLALEGNK